MAFDHVDDQLRVAPVGVLRLADVNTPSVSGEVSEEVALLNCTKLKYVCDQDFWLHCETILRKFLTSEGDLTYQSDPIVNSATTGLTTTQNIEMRVLRAPQRTQHVKDEQPILFWWPAMRIAEEQCSYLAHLTHKSISVARWRNTAYLLSYWHNYCLAADIDWRYASLDELIAFKDAMETSISPYKGTELASGTIAQRMIAVIGFYSWCERQGFYHGDIGKEVHREFTLRALDSDPLAHIGGQHSRHRASQYVPRTQTEEPRPLDVHELRALLSTLGPLPSERNGQNCRPSRDRLLAEWGWAVGLRLHEIMGLTIHQLQVVPPGEARDAHLSIRGKGGVIRTVRVPGWLVDETNIYIGLERKEAARRRKKGQASGALFLVGIDSNRAGQPLSARRFEAVFYDACLKAKLIKRVERVNPDDDSRTIVEVPMHHVHDLRHTYAVLVYWAEVANGNSEPWKLIQVQLGHKYLRTTVDTYLRFVGGRNPFQRISARDLIGLPRSYSQ